MVVEIKIEFFYKGFKGTSSCSKDIRESGSIAKQAIENINFFCSEVDKNYREAVTSSEPVKKTDELENKSWDELIEEVEHK